MFLRNPQSIVLKGREEGRGLREYNKENELTQKTPYVYIEFLHDTNES
jgi:hypothetical protein